MNSIQLQTCDHSDSLEKKADCERPLGRGELSGSFHSAAAAPGHAAGLPRVTTRILLTSSQASMSITREELTESKFREINSFSHPVLS